MGLRMDELHAPTVSQPPASNGSPKDVMSLKELIAERDHVEAELLALSSVLDSHGVNMNTSLTTFDGFPRSDIDVAQGRTTRARVIRLKNDYKGLMSRIEEALHKHHADLQAQTAASSSSAADPTPAPTAQDLPSVAFARINSVAANSPAEAAGLRAGDKLLAFGGVNWLNHDRLSRVAGVVSQNEGKAIEVAISRGQSEEVLQLQLTPRQNWGGRGSLGCHLVPI